MTINKCFFFLRIEYIHYYGGLHICLESCRTICSITCYVYCTFFYCRVYSYLAIHHTLVSRYSLSYSTWIWGTKIRKHRTSFSLQQTIQITLYPRGCLCWRMMSFHLSWNAVLWILGCVRPGGRHSSPAHPRRGLLQNRNDNGHKWISKNSRSWSSTIAWVHDCNSYSVSDFMIPWFLD